MIEDYPDEQPNQAVTERDKDAIIICLLEDCGMRADRIEAFRIRDARFRELTIQKQTNGDMIVCDMG